jgi:glutathionylspermidine synthase
LIGSWIIGDEPHGIVVREGESLITDNTWKVVPHVFFFP